MPIPLASTERVNPPLGVPSKATIRPLDRETRSLRPSLLMSPTAVSKVSPAVVVMTLEVALNFPPPLPGRMRSTPCSLVETRSSTPSPVRSGEMRTSGRLLHPLLDTTAALLKDVRPPVGTIRARLSLARRTTRSG